jgi:hypothetical protein
VDFVEQLLDDFQNEDHAEVSRFGVNGGYKLLRSNPPESSLKDRFQFTDETGTMSTQKHARAGQPA